MVRGYLATLLALALAGCSFDPSVTSARASADDAATADADVVHSYVSYWSFDVDATDQMDAHHGVLLGGAAITTGGQGFGGGEALRLGQEGALVDAENPIAFDFDSDFTWHLYLKTSDDSGALLSRSPPEADWNQGSKALFVRNRSVRFDAYNVGVFDTQVVVDDDEWHQVIVSFRASNDDFRIYVDPDANNPIPAIDREENINQYDEHTHEHDGNLAGSGFSMGNGNSTGGLGSLDTLLGHLDEVAVFDRVIEDGELVQLITSGPRSF